MLYTFKNIDLIFFHLFYKLRIYFEVWEGIKDKNVEVRLVS